MQNFAFKKNKKIILQRRIFPDVLSFAYFSHTFHFIKQILILVSGNQRKPWFNLLRQKEPNLCEKVIAPIYR